MSRTRQRPKGLEEFVKRHRRLGVRALASRATSVLGEPVSGSTIHRVRAELGLSPGRSATWTRQRPDLAPDDHEGAYTARDYLRDHAGEQGVSRLAKEIGCTRAAVSVELSRQRMRMTELRTELTLSAVSRLIGWSESHVRGLVEAKKLRAVRLDGVLRVYPSVLRRWLLEDVRRVQWERVDRDALLEVVTLLMGEWGVSPDSEAGAPRRAGAKGRD